MQDYQKEIDQRKERYGWSYTDFDHMVDDFNLSRLPDYENAAEPYLCYILMSKPMLNLALYNKGRRGYNDEYYQAIQNFNTLKQHSMTAAFANDLYGEKLLLSLSEYGNNIWLPIITTKAMSYTVGDVELKTVDKGNTYYGHVIKYGKHSEDHKISGTMSIDFRNDRYLSILKMMYLWMCYIYIVSKTGAVVPKLLYQRNGILDYASSIYYLVTRRDGRELVYWEKLIGVFPTRCPMSIFSSSDTAILEDRVNIEFTYGIKDDPCDPSILLDINYRSGDTNSSIRDKTRWHSDRYGSGLSNQKFLDNHETPFVKGDVFAHNPYIQIRKDSNGTLKYYLQWEG